MKKRSIKLLALLLAVALVLPNGALAAAGAKTTEMNTAHIASEPAGADVYVDGELYAPAVTPCDVPLSAGTHAISVRMSGYDAVETTAKAGDNVGVHLFATTPKPGDPGVRTLVVAWDDWGTADANFMTWEYYDMFINRKTPRSDDWEDPDLITAYDYFTHFGEAAIGVTLREALCIAMNDTGWYDEENHIRWHYLIEFYEGKDEYMQTGNITCYGRGTAYWMEGNLFTRYTDQGPVEDTDAVENWSHDGCFTVNGDRDRDGTPDVTLYGWTGFGWDGKWNLMLMSSDAHVTGLKFEPTMHVAVSMPFWQRQYYFDFGDVSITNCTFEGIENGVGRFFLGYPGQYGTGADGYGLPGAFDLDGFTISGCTFHTDQLGIIVATGDVDYSSCRNLVLQGNRLTNGAIFVRNVDAHTWYMWPGNPTMSGTENGENCIGVCEYNTLENVTISGNLVEFNAGAIGVNLYDGGYGDVLQVGNSNLGGSHNVTRNVTVRCNRSTIEQANIDAYEFWPNAGLRFENAAIGDGLDEGYDGALASSLCEVSDNLFDGLTVEYNDFELLHFDLTNLSLVGTAQVGTDNYFRNIRFADNRFATVKGMKLTGANGNSNSGAVAEGELENVEITDNTFTCLRKTGWGEDSNINSSGEQDDYGILLVGASVADYRSSNWDESGEQNVWDGLQTTVTGLRIERNRIDGYANGLLVAGAYCERTHYVTGIRVEDVTIADNEITTDGVNKNCRNDGILLAGAIDGGTSCLIHNVSITGNDVTAANGIFAAGFYFMGMRCRYGVRDNQLLHVVARNNRFTAVDPRGYGGFPIFTADAVSGWGEIPYALGKTAVILTESGNAAAGFGWGSMLLAALSQRKASDETAFLADIQNASDAAFGRRYVDWSKDSAAETCETPLFMGVCDRPEYRPGNCHRWYLTPCDAGAELESVNPVAPTCTAAGSYEQIVRCALCSAELSRESKNGDPALGHNFGAWTLTKAPTCTEAGEESRTCSRCTAKETRPVAALGHAWDDGVVTLAPTETEKGEKTFTCTRCGVTRTEDIPELLHEHSYTAVVTPPTCTEQGCTTHTCACGDTYVDTYVPALGHAWDDGVVTLAPTETEKGEKTFTCTRCGVTRTEDIPELLHEHSYTAVVTPPTCTEQGCTTHTCACGDTYVDTYVPALGHAWDAGVVTTPATATKDGVKTFTCTRCGATRTETIPALKPDEPCDGGKTCPSYAFRDVNYGDWYHEAVDFAVERGLFNGMTATTFEPNTPMTRGMLVTVLWRYEDEPSAGRNTFSDVKAGDWYEKAVAWAAENGIVTGVGNNRFDPNGKITREQMAAILFRYSDYKKYDTSKRDDFAGFPDKAKVSGWAKDAYGWAVAEKLITGNSGRLDPQGSATRAQVATILMRFIRNIAKPEITIVSN